MADAEQQPDRWRVVCLLALALLPLWWSLGGHPLNGRTEARYAVVAQAMATGQSGWLVPEFRGEAHLTKPPWAYWVSAVSMVLLGDHAFAARAPSTLAGSALILGVFLFGRRLGGTRRGLLAAGLLGVQPLFVAVMRQPLTDPWLALGWFGVLACGYAVGASWPGRGWVAGFWASVALGLLAKAHLVLLPVGVVVVWLALSERWGALRRLRVWIGLPIAVLPLLAWVLLVIERHPDAVALWRHETLDRAAGDAAGGDHPEAWWYFLPVYLVGLYPANLLVDLPRVGRTVWAGRGGPASMLRKLCRSPNALWWLALGVPLVVFSLNAGKRMNYLLPLTPVIALLAAESLDYWLTQRNTQPDDSPQRPRLGVLAWLRSPAGPATLVFFACAAVGPVVFLRAYERAHPAELLPLALVALGVLAFAVCWRTPRRRGTGLALAFFALVVGWGWGGVLEDRIVTPRSARTLLEHLAQKQTEPTPPPTVYTVGFEDAALVFYGSTQARRIFPNNPEFTWDALRDPADPPWVWMDRVTWDSILADPTLGPAAREHLSLESRWPGRAERYGPERHTFVLLRLRGPAPPAPTR